MAEKKEFDHPCWRYKQGKDGAVESRLFDDISLVPKGEGWEESPAAFEAKADKAKAKADK